MNPTTLRRAATPLALLAFAAAAVAQDGLVSPVGPSTDAVLPGPYTLAIVHINAPGHPTNVVPGLGVPFVAGGTSTSAFGRPTLSLAGLHFAIKAVAATGSTANGDVLLLDGALLLQEGTAAPWLATETVGPIDEEFGLNLLGDLLLGNNTSAATNDDVIVRCSSGTWTELAREAGSTLPLVPGVAGTWDDTMDSARITDLGGIVFRAIGIDGLAGGTANDALVLLPSGGALQKGITVPTGQAGGATNAWENFAADGAYTSADGSVVLVQGDLLGATTSDGIVTVNGAVVLQEGTTLPGFTTAISTYGKSWVDRAGNWYVRGSNLTTNDDWVVRNGIVVANSAGTDEVVPGSGEHWSDAEYTACFFAFDGNQLGQYVIAGVTDGPTATNGVILFDDGLGYRRIVCREGDPIDLDGNGAYDDDRFFSTFGNDDVLLRDDGVIVVVATLRNAAGTSTDQGVFELRPKTGTCTLRNGSGVNPVQCTCITPPVLGTNWVIDLGATPNTLLTFLLASFAPPPAPLPLLGGEVLIDNLGAVVVTGPGTFTIPVPNHPSWYGAMLHVQGVRLDLVGPQAVFVLLNAQDGEFGL